MHPSANLNHPPPALSQPTHLGHKSLHLFHISAPPVTLPSFSRHPNALDFSQLSQLQPSQSRRRQKLDFKRTQDPNPPPQSQNRDYQGSTRDEGDESDCPVEFDDLPEDGRVASGSKSLDGASIYVVNIQTAQSLSGEREGLARPTIRKWSTAGMDGEESRSGMHLGREPKKSIGLEALQANPLYQDDELAQQSERNTPLADSKPSSNT